MIRELILILVMATAPGIIFAGNPWDDYDIEKVTFTDNAAGTEGSELYNRIIPDPEKLIRQEAKTVLSTLYYSPDDSIPVVRSLHYSLDDLPGISAKSGGAGNIRIFLSSRYIAQCDTTKLLDENRGVLLHELTHAFQLEPQGIGDYGSSHIVWSFIEGMADAVRVANGGFGPDDRPKGGKYDDGYRVTGYFFVWIKDNKDPDFLRKLNRSTLEIIPWSYDEAFRSILGEEVTIEDLWQEYQSGIANDVIH